MITNYEEKSLYSNTLIKEFKYFEDLDTLASRILEN